jgi:hypothetical protein
MTQKYADFMTAQNKAMSPANASAVVVQEGEDSNITKLVRKKDDDSSHIGTHGDEHVYMGGQGDRESTEHHIHNAKTGVTHSVNIDHADAPLSHKEVHSQVDKQTKGAVSTGATKHIHNAMKEDGLAK